MSKKTVVHCIHRLHHDSEGVLIGQSSECCCGGLHLAMTDDWEQVTCKNCLKFRPVLRKPLHNPRLVAAPLANRVE